LEARTVNEKIDISGGFYSETSAVDESKIPKSYTQHVLRLPDTDTEIPLGKELSGTNQYPEPSKGMDPSTFTLQRLQSQDVLVATWKTHSIAGGRWVVEAMVVLERKDDDWREVFRDYHDNYYSGGWMTKNGASLSLSSADEQDGFTLTLLRTSYNASEEPRPLARPVNVSTERTWYGFQSRSISEWPCRIDDGKLVCDEGTAYFDLGEVERFEIVEVAQYLAYVPKLETDEQRDKVEAKVKELRELNPGLAEETEINGVIKVGTVPLYEPHPEHRWSTR